MTQLRIMMKAAESALTRIKERGTQIELLDRMQTRAELYDLVKYHEYTALDREIAARFGIGR
jgi:methylisocitrate lyase